MVREPDATMQPTLQDNQLMSKHRVLGFKPQLRLEGRGQDGQNETKQPDHSASLGDFFTSSTRMRFSVHTPAQFSRLVVDQANAQQLLDDADGVGALFRRPIGKHILEHLQPPWTDCSRIVIGLDPPGAIIIRPHRSAFTGPWVHQAALCRNETVSVPGNIRLPTEMLLPLDPCARLVDQLTGARLAEVLGSGLGLRAAVAAARSTTLSDGMSDDCCARRAAALASNSCQNLS